MSIIFFFTFFSFLLLFFTQLLLSSTLTPTHNRRALHQSFLLTSSPSPTQPSSPSFPKYPSSSSSSSRNNQCLFFPLPHLPSPTTLSHRLIFSSHLSRQYLFHSFSSLPPLSHQALSYHHPPAPHPRHRSSFFRPLPPPPPSSLHRCQRSLLQQSPPLPPNSTTSDGRKFSFSSFFAPTASNFLYLGTLVSSHCRTNKLAAPITAYGSSYQKLSSPELCPLPPLPRQCQNADGGGSAERGVSERRKRVGDGEEITWKRGGWLEWRGDHMGKSRQGVDVEADKHEKK